MIGETRALLEQWGRWKRYGTGMPRYASPSAVLMASATGSTLPEACITDDLAMGVDAAVARLKLRDKEMGRAVYVYFTTEEMTFRALGKLMGINKDRAERLVHAGLCWIDGVLSVPA